MTLAHAPAINLFSGKSSAFAVSFGASEAANASTVNIPVRWLAGDVSEEIFTTTRFLGITHGFTLHEAGDLLIGSSTQPVEGNHEAAARELYRRLFAVTSGRHLYRIWNYVPAINANSDDLENYRAFCSGRSHAFASALGDQFKPKLPSASAVGCSGDSLSLIFVAGRTAPHHFENPQQIAAYNYPPEHGPQAPSFSRATATTHTGKPVVFISGTAAIKGHVTVAPGKLGEQLHCTFDNLRLISETVGTGKNLGRGDPWQRHFKIYLRHASDLDEVAARFEGEIFQTGDHVIYVEADICRAALNVEIEATLVGL
ncbi:hypothetical protein [Oleiharenicola lentus]|uniref:chorismate transformation enzyme, FkbO/Hyg5 family n=1 Tax=Oleiharenicola lentus TaxID=2508720 RepID=UPI003F66C253